MNVTLKSTWMVHSGGTKYYQVFQLQPVFAGTPVTIVHYGPMRSSHLESANYRPVKGGQVQLVRGVQMNVKVNAKKTRGYSVMDTTNTTIDIGETFESGDKKLIEIFGASHAFSIHQILTKGDLDESDSGPTAEPETIDIPGMKPAITARPESWGTW